MNKNNIELYNSCMEIADNLQFMDKNISFEKNIKMLADKFYSIAVNYGDVYKSLGLSESLLIHAVNYIKHTHAHPRNGFTWFDNILEVIIELSCPNVIPIESSSKIFKYIQEGMSVSIQRMKVEINDAERNEIDVYLEKIDPVLVKRDKVLGKYLILIILIS